MARLILLLVIALLFVWTSSEKVKISNLEPRRDTDGVWMDIHDGKVVAVDGIYYYFGGSYGFCREPDGDSGCNPTSIGSCGFQTNHNVTLFTSKDLKNWKNEGSVFQTARDHPVPGSILFCPKVLFNKQTKMWVLWYNWIAGTFDRSYYSIAVSSTPTGPFKVVNSNLKTLKFDNAGDFNLFQDDNNDAYVIYTSKLQGPEPSHQMSLEKLAPDYLSSLPNTSTGYFGNSFVEAPAMFKRDGLYYTVFGTCCCYCKGGGPVTYYTSKTPLGPYQQHEVISANIPSQQTDIWPFFTKNNKVEYMWIGNRWQSAPDRLKGHDFQFWSPIQFDAAGSISPLQFIDEFEIDV